MAPLYNWIKRWFDMGLKVDDLKTLSDAFAQLKKPRKKDLDAVKKMLGRFKNLFPPEKSSVELIRELRDQSLNQ